MGDSIMQASRSIKRQSAWHMLASEFGESTLNEKGSGEFDPSFVITKLGSKVNRVIVAGLLERLEPRDTANGSVLYQGQIRDPSGVHYFSVGDYASDSMRELTLQLSPKVENGEPILLLMVAKTRLFQTEEGAIYTSLRPEEACEIDSNRYATWLTKTCQDTLERMKIFTDSLDFEPTIEALTKENVPSHMIEGLVSSRNHYGDIDLEHYNLNIMQALDIAEGKIEAASTPPQQQIVSISGDGEGESSADSDELGDILLDIIKKLDQGEGVDFETLITNASARGFSRSIAEEKIESLSDEGSIHEPAFGWFRIVS
jgi:RPA family protein